VGIAARGLGIETERGLRRAGEVAAYADRHLGRATALLSDGHVYHAGGGSEAQELAATMATAVAYLRAAEAAGLPPERAARQIAFRLAVDADVFLSIAKLRAARLLWARICEVSGASAEGMQLHAMTASRMLTRRDPFNNVLRTTLATYAAAMGGADAVTVLPFDYALGLPDPLARRLARNVQLVLMEESQLHRVIDPMGGAWFIEDLTRRLATEAWSLFQAIEGGGGIVDMLMKGTVQDWIAATVAERNDAIARRREPITGVSEFPNLAEQPWQPETCDTARLVARFRDKALHAQDTRGLPFPAMIEVCARGGTVLYRGSLASYTSIPPRRLAEPFEALRDRSDAVLAATGQRPRLFLACLGAAAQFGARLTFAQNLLAAGGIEAVPSEPLATGEAAGPAWSAAATPVAALCAGDETYGACGVAAIEALLAAGCRRVWVFGKPPEEAALAMAGADGFVRAGDDVLQVLERMHDILGEAP
jgi:methylmalonyl-CoA mutase